MYSAGKKTLILNILDILKKYTDSEHTLSQKDIEDILYRDYGMVCERKSIKRNLTDLRELGYRIRCTETPRTVTETDENGNKRKVTTYIESDFYLERDISDAELRLIIDSLLFSGNIPVKKRTRLIKKLEGLSNVYFKSRVGHVYAPCELEGNQQLFDTIALLDEAISKKRQVYIIYGEYHTDKKLHPRTRPDGTVREYIINPYQMAVKEGKYYLICNNDKYNDIGNFRIDRIIELKLLPSKVKPFESLRGTNGEALNLAKYMSEHIYMYASDNSRVTFRCDKTILNNIFDLFGNNITFWDEDETHVTVSAFVNEMAMARFARNFIPYVVILSPQSLADEVKADLKKALELYEQ